MLSDIASDSVIDTAYAWLCHQRRNWPADSDIWDLRFHWDTVKETIQRDLTQECFCFEPMSRITKANGEVVHVWSSRDALILKALSAVLANHLPVSMHCTHVKGHGGAKATI